MYCLGSSQCSRNIISRCLSDVGGGGLDNGFMVPIIKEEKIPVMSTSVRKKLGGTQLFCFLLGHCSGEANLYNTGQFLAVSLLRCWVIIFLNLPSLSAASLDACSPASKDIQFVDSNMIWGSQTMVGDIIISLISGGWTIWYLYIFYRNDNSKYSKNNVSGKESTKGTSSPVYELEQLLHS